MDPDPATPMNLDDVATFVRVVDVGSFAAAGRSLTMPRSTVSRRVARLETQLGTQLLHRTTRSIALTDAGHSFYATVSTALFEIEQAAGIAAADRSDPTGTVRLCAPPDVGSELLPMLLAPFIARNPKVRVEVELSPVPPNLLRDGFDLALRNGRPADETTRATKLQDTPFGLYASAGYLDANGEPDAVADLTGHSCLIFGDRKATDQWRLAGADGGRETVRVSGPLSATDFAFIRRAAMAGTGITMLPIVVGDREVAGGTLRRVLPGYSTKGIPLYLVKPATPHLPLRVRALAEHLIDAFPE